MQANTVVREGDRVTHESWPEIEGTVVEVLNDPNPWGYYQVAVRWDRAPEKVEPEFDAEGNCTAGNLWPYRTSDFERPMAASIASLRFVERSNFDRNGNIVTERG